PREGLLGGAWGYASAPRRKSEGGPGRLRSSYRCPWKNEEHPPRGPGYCTCERPEGIHNDGNQHHAKSPDRRINMTLPEEQPAACFPDDPQTGNEQQGGFDKGR